METNLIESIKNQAFGALTQYATTSLGESEGATKTALGALVPVVLSGFAQKGSSQSGADGILEMIKGNKTGLLDNLGSVLGNADDSKGLLDSGKGIIASLFGNKTSSIIDLIAPFAGIKKESANSLMSLAGPVVLGALGKEVAGKNLGASGLMGLLGGQTNFIKAALPSGLAGLGDLAGLGSLAGIGSAAMGAVGASKGATGSRLPVLAVLGLLAAAAAFITYKNINSLEKPLEGDNHGYVGRGIKQNPAVAARQAAQALAAKVDPKLGAFFGFTLPNGVALNIPENGIENRLIKFIADPAQTVQPAETATWYSFDRINFETGKSTLTAESAEQVKNIAEILNAFPTVSLKIGGYTDNVGDDAANLKLSGDRATTVMNELLKLGVAPNRLSAEGYGKEHPVCPANDTDECKAQNRRIDVRVSAK